MPPPPPPPPGNGTVPKLRTHRLAPDDLARDEVTGRLWLKDSHVMIFLFLCNIVISAIIFIGGKFVHEQGRDCVICLISAVVMITTITDIKQLL